MRRWAILATLAATMVLQSGCTGGVGYSAREQRHRAERVFENDMKQLADDIETFLLNDRPIRTSRWTTD